MNGTMSVGTGVLTKPDPDREDEGTEVTVRLYDEDLSIVAQGVATLSDFALATYANRANVPARVTVYGPDTDAERARKDTGEILRIVRSAKDEPFATRHAVMVWGIEQTEAVWAEGRPIDYGALPEGL
jgi:hypothetical protein